MDFDKVKGIVNRILEKEKYPMYSVSPSPPKYVRVVRNRNCNKEGEKYIVNDKIIFAILILTYE